MTGVRVVELATGVAAAAAGRALADLGAEVVRVEAGPGGSTPAAELRELLDAGKRRVARPAGDVAGWLPALLADVDGLITDAPVDAVALVGGAQGLVILSFDPDLPGAATSARLLHATAQTSIDTRGSIPVAPPGNIPYYDAAMMGVFAFLATRWSTPPGDRHPEDRRAVMIRIDTEAVELAHGRPDLTRAANEKLSGERDPFLALFLQCGDGEIAAHINRAHWSEWVEVIGRPELEADPRFATMPDLLDNQDQAVAEVEHWCRQHTRDEIEALCQDRGIPVGAVLRPAEVAVDRQLVSRGFVGPDGRPALLPFLLAEGERWRAPASEAPEERQPADGPVGVLR